MKICLAFALLGSAFSLAEPTFAQQKEPKPDPKLRQALEAHDKKLDEAQNNGDAAAKAALYAKDAILVTDTGPIKGREAIQKHFADLFQQVHFSNSVGVADPDSPHVIGKAGNEMWVTGAWSCTIKGQNFGPTEIKSYWGSIKVLEGGVWKVLMETWNVTPAPR
jgi:uncharacterized protein (TIGR02246 family)